MFSDSLVEFWDCFMTIRVKFSRLFLDNSDRIFGTIFGKSKIGLRFGFDPRIDVFGFCVVFWYHRHSMTNREGTKRCPVLYGSEIWAILCVIAGKIMLLYTCLTY